MRLDRIDIANFRSIEAARLDFEPRCRTLIGKNEVGKTNLLSACGLLDPNAPVTAADLRETRDGEDPVKAGHVNFVFSFSTEEMKLLASELEKQVLGIDHPLCSRRSKALTCRQFLQEFREWIHVVKIPDGKRYNTHWEKKNFKLVAGWRMPRGDVDLTTSIQMSSGSSAPVGSFILVHESLLAPEQLEHFEVVEWDVIVKKFWNLITTTHKLNVPKCLYWSYSEANLLPPNVDLEGFKSNPGICEPLKAMFVLAGEKNPSEAIQQAQARPNGVKNLLSRVARATTAHVRTRWKEIGTIEIVLTPNGGQIDAAVRDAFNEFSFNRRSDGFKRFVSFLILISARSAASDFLETLFIQDEPDLGLHPSGIKSLLGELIDISKNNYVLISSHSIFMVDKERVDRHLVVSKNDETTVVKPVDRSALQDEEVLFNALGYSLFELIKPTNLVFEGWRDKKLFQVKVGGRGKPEKFLRDMQKTELGLTHAMGVKDIPKVATYFDVLERRTIAISDGDDVAIEKQRQVLAQKPDLLWKLYDELLGVRQVLTAEDFIRASKLRLALLSVVGAKGLDLEIDAELIEAPPPGGVVKTVTQALIANGIQESARKELLNAWKSAIFDDLSLEDIAEQYDGVVLGIATLLGYGEEADSAAKGEPA